MLGEVQVACDGDAIGAGLCHPTRMATVDPIPPLKQLGVELARLLAGWNADDIAVVIGTDRPRIAELRRGQLARFSLETLIRYLARLQHRVDLTVTRERITRERVTRAEVSRNPSAE